MEYLTQYEDFLLKNASQITSIESALRSLTYILPGMMNGEQTRRFHDAEFASQALYATLNLVGLYHNSILRRAVEEHHAEFKNEILEESAFNKYLIFWSNKSQVHRQVSHALAVISYTQVLMEMGVLKKWGKATQWRWIAFLETVKVILRLTLFRLTSQRMTLQPTHLQRDIDPAMLAQRPKSSSDHFSIWTGQRTGKEIPRMKTAVADVQDYLMSKVLTPEKLRRPDQMVHVMNLLGRFGEILYILRPLIYVLAILRYGQRSWRPWLLSLAVELASQAALRKSFDGGRRTRMFPLEKQEMSRRANLLWWNLLRGAFYTKITRPRLERYCNSVENKAVLSMVGNKEDKTRSSWLLSWLAKLTHPLSPQEDKHTDDLCSVHSIRQAEPIDVPLDTTQRSNHNRNSIVASVVSSSGGRRNSQQTTGSSVLSDDQLSAGSYQQQQQPNDKSILSDLWSKARKRHPNHPRFHWPHHQRLPRAIPHSVSGGSPRTSQDEFLRQEQQQSHSYQEYRLAAPLLGPANHHHHGKRHSITSLISDDNTPMGSRPASIFCSQPVSPNFAAMMKDGHLLDYNEQDDDIDPYWLDENHRSSRVTDRWILKHDLVRLALDGLFCGPMDGAADKHVLQIACGDAAWGIETALTYPQWIVVGMDDHDGGPSPNRRTVPRNFKFIRCYDSLLEGLKTLPDHAFDLLHCRFLILSYTANQYQQLVHECWRLCKPGGSIELIEMDMRIYHGRPMGGRTTQALNSEVIHVMESKSFDPRLARRLPDLFHTIDPFIQTQANYKSLPLGIWAGKMGVMFRDDLHDLIELARRRRADGQEEDSDQELDRQFEQMDEEIEMQRSFMNLYYCYAVKS
ncbi:Peroxisomal membrane protein pex16 [Apophysomyces ossiformis]|uniref:Peroxisomal membrane protein pex16 n=1 Tax=Apophysomyces ossiformis TaxID=679940 RepID=A0A8H7ER09_9FUNG|nr:Peroxisomal membrane protein pex16 [Apophysomyces ossiformis]